MLMNQSLVPKPISSKKRTPAFFHMAREVSKENNPYCWISVITFDGYCVITIDGFADTKLSPSCALVYSNGDRR